MRLELTVNDESASKRFHESHHPSKRFNLVEADSVFS